MLNPETQPPLITRLAHICIIVPSLPDAEAFYCAILGLTRQFTFKRGQTEIGFYLAAGATTFLEIFQGDCAPEPGPSPLQHFCLEVSDLETLHQRLTQAGHQPTDIILPQDNTRQFWCHAPGGLNIEFQQYTPKSLQLQGGTAQVE